MQIERIKIQNYRVFRDTVVKNLPELAVFVGANGSGKSTLFDVFGFLRDALKENVRTALGRRGGFAEVRSRDAEGPIHFEIKFRNNPGEPLVTYALTIDLGKGGRPVVERELLKYRRGGHGRPWHFLDFRRGKGRAIRNEEDYGKENAREEREEQELESPDILAIKGLGQFQRFKAVAAFRRLIESWHLSDFHIADARPSQEVAYAEHLSSRGDNLPLVTQYLFEHHRDQFDQILTRMAARVPGVAKVEAKETVDGRVVLRFQDGAFKDPSVARFVSDGTIKSRCSPTSYCSTTPSLTRCCALKKPENQLYPTLLHELAEEFRNYARRGGQVLVSTHSPDLLNGVRLDEIFWLRKEAGSTVVERASGSKLLKDLVKEGDLPGALWKQGLFEGVNP